jgi:hypothetical protein
MLGEGRLSFFGGSKLSRRKHDLAIAMAKTAQFQSISPTRQSWVAPPLAKLPSTISFKEATLIELVSGKKGEVHFIPDLKVGVFVTLLTPDVIKFRNLFSIP